MTPVFLHGAGFTGEAFEAQLDAFPQAHAPNLPGHLSDGAPESIAEFAEFVEQYLSAHRVHDAVLCGHSMGGAIALETALRGRAQLRGVVLLDSGARLRVAPAIVQGLSDDFDRGVAHLVEFFFSNPTNERTAWAAGQMRQVGKMQTVRDFQACNAFDALERLGSVSVPLLALTGEADRLTPPKFAEALASRVPGAQARMIAGAGHFAMVERPDETNAAIRTFLSGLA